MWIGLVGLSLVASVVLSGCVISAHSGHHYPTHYPQPVVVMKPYHHGYHYSHREHHRGHHSHREYHREHHD